MVSSTIACFLTCGYTESGSMQSFLRRINGAFEYRQYLPNKTRKRKGSPKLISRELSGLTGTELLDKTLRIIEQNINEAQNWGAILYEDDADELYCSETYEEIQSYITYIQHSIRNAVRRDIPVIVLFASPEIESWFIADWSNGFEYLYSDSGVVDDIEYSVAKYFCHRFRAWIASTLQANCRDEANIETYNCFSGTEYTKLSTQIINFFEPHFLQAYIHSDKKRNLDHEQQIVSSRRLFYSKKEYGDIMLRNIDPNVLAKTCTLFFAVAYRQLVALNPTDI